ncbi:alpha/beta hydrolase [Sphingosinicella sp. LY1275]|uniref:alpha/beta fold hydrolase n=1 Tax=Sphingosinicella sp. LY1275 TaxID=3095379 RepID=UPI002ADEFC57|nr:alpha/beta hydrolase [Sphingosinicella sp. LY1275]MEA1015611.1 alpha/beta hydrolase [Sphingosinicella sp. LY1275]
MTQKPNKKAQPGHFAAPSRSEQWLVSAKQNKSWLAAGTTAAVLAASAWFNRARARRVEEENPPVGKFVVVDGVRLHYVDRGKGTPVVLLHGNGVMLQDFEASGILGLAAEHHRVLAFDRPGFGYSDRPRTTIWTPAAQAELIAKALKEIGAEGAVVVGHSWGTMVAIAMALDHPEAVAGLVLLSGYYYGSARPDVVPFSVPAIPLLGDVIAHTVAPLTGLLTGPAAVKASFAPAAVSEKFADLPIAMALRPSQVRATAADTALMIPGAVALSRRYRELRLPVIIMAGEGDLIAHIGKHSERLVEDIGGSDLRVVPEQGHLFHYAVPEQVVRAITDVVGRRR